MLFSRGIGSREAGEMLPDRSDGRAGRRSRWDRGSDWQLYQSERLIVRAESRQQSVRLSYTWSPHWHRGRGRLEPLGTLPSRPSGPAEGEFPLHLLVCSLGARCLFWEPEQNSGRRARGRVGGGLKRERKRSKGDRRGAMLSYGSRPTVSTTTTTTEDSLEVLREVRSPRKG